MKTFTAAVAAAAVVSVLVPAVAWAQGDLEDRVKVLEHKLEQQAADPTAAPAVSAGDKGFGFKSADGGFEFKLRGLLQTDARFFADDGRTLNDTFLVRRLEPSFEFGLGKLAFFKVQPQFAGDSVSTADMYGELRFHPAAALRFGKFKTPLGLENLQSSTPLMLIERGLPFELGPVRDVGLQLAGEVLGGTTTYAIAWGNGAPDGRDAAASDTDTHKEFAARVFFEPFRNEPGFFRGLGVGIAGTRGTKLGAANGTTSAATFNNTLPRYRSPGQNVIFTYTIPASGVNLTNTVIADGEHTRLSPQLYFYRGGFGLLAEHMSSEQEVSFNSGAAEAFEHTAWQVVASYVLTGEDASYKGFKPNVPYGVGAPGWGAFEVSARHGVLDIDDGVFGTYADPAVSVSKASNTGVALNWYMTANVRISLDYEVTAFDGGAAAGADRADEKVLLTRLQLAF